MVRTLVFHTNNVGSIPAGLTIGVVWSDRISKKRLFSDHRCASVRYSFRFISVISADDMVSSERPASSPYSPLPSRVLMRRSFLLVSWLFYLSSAADVDSQTRARLAVLPAKRSLYTLTKAPMAHKTRSKEQFMFKTYNFKFSVLTKLDPNLTPNSVQSGGHVGFLMSEKFPVLETNSLFLKSFLISYPVTDKIFFSSMT